MSQSASNQPVIARILVVEDHPEVARIIRTVLGRRLIDSTVVTSGEEALKRLAQDRFDLILLDIGLPGMSGLEVCRKLKADQVLRKIPVIFVSGQTSPPYKEEARSLGAVDFIEKPFELLDFLGRVMGHLNLHAKESRR